MISEERALELIKENVAFSYPSLVALVRAIEAECWKELSETPLPDEFCDKHLPVLAAKHPVKLVRLLAQRLLSIEAECQKVPGSVWMLSTKTFLMLFATEQDANDWQQANGFNTATTYIQPKQVPVLAAAPKPERREESTISTEHGPWVPSTLAGEDEYCQRCLTVRRYAHGRKCDPHIVQKVEHDLYKTGDRDVPNSIKDRNGEVVLGLCKKCGRGEIELEEPCTLKQTESVAHSRMCRCLSCMAPKPVAQEPVAWWCCMPGQDPCLLLEEPPDSRYPKGYKDPLYFHPQPDQSAEVERQMNRKRKYRKFYIEAQERIAELETEVMEQCRINGMGSEREAALLGKVDRLEAALRKARNALARSGHKLAAYVGVCTGDKELTEAVLPMSNEAIAAIDEVLNTNSSTD